MHFIPLHRHFLHERISERKVTANDTVALSSVARLWQIAFSPNIVFRENRNDMGMRRTLK